MKALVRAHRWQRLLECGRHASVRQLARAEDVNRAYIARLLNLTLLAPDIVEAVLDGREPQDVTLPTLLKQLPDEWRAEVQTLRM